VGKKVEQDGVNELPLQASEWHNGKRSGTVLHNWKEADDNDHDALSSY
jgi:hypothetical protein